ncbi:helix-turn-helix domain-containing protein [Dawidia soli]|uniref:Helix-turn-helix domain-containing protein n=1 Tax=Dawidia soli TaxID=2782352 RepID=A0AAP2D8S1_9BACT|nr:helix-turn-helix transcriptional regulator [Dawidia soli]MBT1686190.1 helix-turn-helix domain-containing protein [Dawidia soli]
MSESIETSNKAKAHHGHNVKRFRQMLGLKQEAFGEKLGDDWTIRRVSYLENQETIEPELIDAVAKALGIPSEVLLNFDEEKAVYNIQHNHDNAVSHAHGAVYYTPTFNPLDKYDQLVEKMEKLYDALLQSEREKNALLERLLAEKSK